MRPLHFRARWPYNKIMKNTLRSLAARDSSALAAREVSDRRIAALTASGDAARNTPAWQDACYERGMLSYRAAGLGGRWE